MSTIKERLKSNTLTEKDKVVLERMMNAIDIANDDADFTIEDAIQKKVFLGGTCNNSNWREQLIPHLNIDYFNPVVKDWTDACKAEEIRQRGLCDYLLYVITPAMSGVYSIAEVVDDSNKKPDKTVFCLLDSDDNASSFSDSQMKSLEQVGELVKRNGGKYFKSLDEVTNHLNNS